MNYSLWWGKAEECAAKSAILDNPVSRGNLNGTLLPLNIRVGVA
jgi:hypothetical protein